VSAVKRLTDDKVLTAELTLTSADTADERQQRRQVILYDRQLNINSSLAEKHITFAATDTGQ